MIATLGLTIVSSGLVAGFVCGCGMVRGWFERGEERRYGGW